MTAAHPGRPRAVALAVAGAIGLIASQTGAATAAAPGEDTPGSVRAVPRVMSDPVPGRWTHDYTASLAGKPDSSGQAEFCLPATEQQHYVDSAIELSRLPLFGGCYGSMVYDTPDYLEMVSHCDPTRVVDGAGNPPLAGFTARLTVRRTRAPEERWTMEITQPGVRYTSTFTRIGGCASDSAEDTALARSRAQR